MVQHTLRLETPPILVPSPRTSGHRARIKLGIEGTEVGYRRARSHELVSIETCAVARPEVNAALAKLRQWLSDHGPIPFREVEIRSDGTRAVFAFEGSRKRMPPDLQQLGDVAVGGKLSLIHI